MDLYTLDSNFLKQDVVDEFMSVIWTERYSTSGEVVLETTATPEMITKLAEGTFLALSGSEEVMILDTQSIENGKLKVQGKTLLEALKERLIRTTIDHKHKQWLIPTMWPGHMIAYIVEEMVTAEGSAAGETTSTVGFDGLRQVIPNLSIGDVDLSEDPITVLVPFGKVYDAITEIAKDEIGMSLYLESANQVGYSLKFTTYRGLDRTKNNEAGRAIVRFSPAMNSLVNIKELRSIAGYKTVAYAFASGLDADPPITIPPGIAYASPDDQFVSGFKRRTLMVFCDDIDNDAFSGTSEELTTLLNLRAKDALANNNFTRVVDGEIVPQGEYQFGTHYKLGDIIELQGHSGHIQKARITEYIRIQDNTGERAHPTVSVID